MPVQIYNENTPAGDAVHFAQELYYILIPEMMGEQRTERVVKLSIYKRQFKGIGANRGNLRELPGFVQNCLRRSFVQLQSHKARVTMFCPRPFCGHAK